MKYLLIPALLMAVILGACHPGNGNNVNPSTAVWGDLIVRKTTSDSAFLYPPNVLKATAIFYSAPNNYTSRVPVTSVAANGNTLTDNNARQYTNDPGAGTDTTVSWEVNGSSQVPTFSYNDAGPFPGYSGPGLPDTLIRANGFTMYFPANTISGGDSVIITFSEIARATTLLVSTQSMDQNHRITFSPQDLSILKPGNLNLAQLTIIKTTDQTYSGKQYRFSKQRVFYRRITLI